MQEAFACTTSWPYKEIRGARSIRERGAVTEDIPSKFLIVFFQFKSHHIKLALWQRTYRGLSMLKAHNASH